MLITTHAGIVVNSDHIAYIALKRQEPEGGLFDTPGAENPPEGFKVLLFLAGGDSVVAATQVPEEAAQFLRRDIAHWWAEGNAALDVAHALQRHAEGAYYTRDGADQAVAPRNGG